MKRFAVALFAGALLMVSGLSAAAKDDKRHFDPYVTGPADEAKMVREVRHQLVTLPYYSVFDDIGFTVNGGTVTLVGQVVMPVVKDDAGKVVRKVEGVSNVVNDIEV